MSTRLRRVLPVLGHEVRASVRPGFRSGPPVGECNGPPGASLDLLEPFVDAVDPRIEVVTFDVPGAGGSPTHRAAVQLPDARLVPDQAARPGSVYDRFDVLGISWGSGLSAAGGLQTSAALPPTGAREHRHRVPDGPGQPARAAQDAHPAPVSRPRLRQVDRGPAVRRSPASRTRGGADAVARALSRRYIDVATCSGAGRCRLDQPAPLHRLRPTAHPDPCRHRRPDHSPGQRPDHGTTTSRRHAAYLRRRTPRSGHSGADEARARGHRLPAQAPKVAEEV